MNTLGKINKFKKGGPEGPCCESPSILEKEGYKTCTNCGTVHSRVIFNGERRAFNQDEINNRKSNERVYSPIGTRTILPGNRDAKGNYLNPKDVRKYAKLSKIHKSLISSYERNMSIALPNLQKIQRKLNISDAMKDDIIKIYNEVFKRKLIMGRGIDDFLCACTYTILKMRRSTTTMEEVAETLQIPLKTVNKAYSIVRFEILPDVKLGTIGPDQYVDKFYSNLGLSMQCRNFAIKLIKIAIENGYQISGRDPKGIAAAALYLSSKRCNELKTQKEISAEAKVTDVTLRGRAKEILDFSEN